MSLWRRRPWWLLRRRRYLHSYGLDGTVTVEPLKRRPMSVDEFINRRR